MNKTLLRLLLAFALFALGVVAGMFHEYFSSGFHRSVQHTDSFFWDHEPILSRVVSEYVGFGFMTPSTSELEFDGRLIYKAQAVFQEGRPFVRDVAAKGKTVSWSDGDYRYQLAIERIPEPGTPAKAVE